MHKVLVVEDNEMNREMIGRYLERKGYQIIEASDGKEGVEKAGSELPDLILMDLSLPVLDGWQAVQQLKASPKTKSIPVICLSAHAMPGDREKALKAGCDEYESKPVNFSELLKKINSLLNRQN